MNIGVVLHTSTVVKSFVLSLKQTHTHGHTHKGIINYFLCVINVTHIKKKKTFKILSCVYLPVYTSVYKVNIYKINVQVHTFGIDILFRYSILNSNIHIYWKYSNMEDSHIHN